ncbi:MAG TPA: DUF4432 family protein [Candidatus Atribacteria bacterium]|jgi:hypothetical protein|nr:DUF4432 family protein [Candidatus Atribacteria bacterium]
MEKPDYNNFYHYNRNYGCRVQEIIWNGFKTLIIENEKLRVSILVDKGTDIFELLYKPMDIDFMWRSPLEVNTLNPNLPTKSFDAGNYMDTYEGGWQEIIPNISTPSNYKGAAMGFHGELVLLPWKYEVITDTPYEVKVLLKVRMKRAPLLVKKYITLKSNESLLEFEEIIQNEADEEYQFMWGHHPTYGIPFLDESCVIDFPQGVIGQVYQEDFSGTSIFPANQEFNWPYLKDLRGNQVDLSRVMAPEMKTAFNIYIKNLKDGWYGITNLSKGIGIGFQWDVNIFKYLLMWSVYRGFYGFPFYGKTYNLALELYSAIPDDLDEVIRLNRALCLKPGEELRTIFHTIVYQSSSRIQGFNQQHQPILLDE